MAVEYLLPSSATTRWERDFRKNLFCGKQMRISATDKLSYLATEFSWLLPRPTRKQRSVCFGRQSFIIHGYSCCDDYELVLLVIVLARQIDTRQRASLPCHSKMN